MVKRIIAYLAVVLITLYAFFLFDDKVTRYLLILEIIYFVADVGILAILNKRVRVSIVPLGLMADKNKQVPIEIRVQNQLKSLSVTVQGKIKVVNLTTNAKTSINFRTTVSGNDIGIYRTELIISECGVYRVTVDKYYIMDLFNLLCIRQKANVHKDITVLPEINLSPIELSLRTRMFVADADEYSSRESGDDPHEMYQIREYTEQDSVHDIHWKLSAKSDDILIKERAKPEGCTVLLWIDFSDVDKKRKKKKKVLSSQMLDIVASLSYSMLEQECKHIVMWYEKDRNDIAMKKVMKEENIYELLSRLLYVKTYDKKQDSDEVKVLFDDKIKNIDFCNKIEVGFGNELIVNGKALKIPREGKKVKWEEMYIKL